MKEYFNYYLDMVEDLESYTYIEKPSSKFIKRKGASTPPSEKKRKQLRKKRKK